MCNYALQKPSNQSRYYATGTIKPVCSWCDALHNHGGEASFAADQPSPWGEGAERPFPCRSRVTGNGIQAASRSPPPPGRSRGLLPPPQEGAGSVWRYSGYRARGKQDLRGVSRLKPGEGMLSRGSASMGNRPRGGGARREGGGTSPSPVPTCHRERFSWSTPSPVSCVSG